MRATGFIAAALAALLAGSAAAQDAPPMGRATPLRALNPGRWITNGDYPREARRHHVQGVSVFRLEIDKTGKVTACTILGSSGSDLLDGTTCQLLLRRARFGPALDGRGNPIPARYTNSFHWTL